LVASASPPSFRNDSESPVLEDPEDLEDLKDAILPAWLGAAPAAFTPAAFTPAAAASAEPARARRLRPRLAHGDGSSTELFLIELIDGRLGGGVRGHFDEREASRSAGRHVTHDANRLNRTGLREERFELLVRGLKWEIADIELSIHCADS